jgi:hypothetical protein
MQVGNLFVASSGNTYLTILEVGKVALKTRGGLSGFINGTQASAIADTGSAQNIISAAYASDMELPIEYTPSSF